MSRPIALDVVSLNLETLQEDYHLSSVNVFNEEFGRYVVLRSASNVRKLTLLSCNASDMSDDLWYEIHAESQVIDQLATDLVKALERL